MRVLLDVSRHSGHFALRPRHVGGGGNGLNQNRLARWRSRRGGGGRSRILKVESAKHVGKLYMKKETFLSLQTITNHAGTCKNREKIGVNLRMECPEHAGPEWWELVFP